MLKLQEIVDNLLLEKEKLEIREENLKSQIDKLKDEYLSNRDESSIKLDLLKSEIIKIEKEYNLIICNKNDKVLEIERIVSDITKCGRFNLCMIGEILAEYITRISSKEYVFVKTKKYVIDEPKIPFSNISNCNIKRISIAIIIAKDKVESEPYIKYIDNDLLIEKMQLMKACGTCNMFEQDLYSQCTVDKYEDLKKAGDICEFYPLINKINSKSIEDEIYFSYYGGIKYSKPDFRPKINSNIYSEEINNFIYYIIEERYKRHLFKLEDVNIEFLRKMLNEYLKR